MSSPATPRGADLERWQWVSLGVGVVFLALCAAGLPFSPEQFFRSYLTAYLFYLGIGLGSMSILMLYYLTGGAWGFLIRRVLEAGMQTLPLLAVLFIPIAFGLGYLYLWAQPSQIETNQDIQKKLIYLNPPFFYVRAAIYFALWCGAAFLLSRWSRQEDRTGDRAASGKLVFLSGPGLIAYGVSITFASVDWVMSLQPAFRSTIFGPVFASGQLLSAMAFALIVMAWLVTRPPLAELVSLEALNDLGTLLFTFLVVWAYLVYFQYMLVWIANLPYDVSWFTPRLHDGWQYVAWALVVFGFFIPFFLLLMRDVKRNPASLAWVAALLLLMQLAFMYYQVQPSFRNTTLADHWMDFLAPVGLGGIWLAYFFWQLRGSTVLPRHDVNAEAAAHFRRLDEEGAARHAGVQHG
jgi:hypothetical protein